MSENIQTGAVECKGCKGTGICSCCNGDGKPDSRGIILEESCIRCGGNGVCPGCKGSGWIVIPIIYKNE